MTDDARVRHAELMLAAINAEAHSRRLNDHTFREYVRQMLAELDLPVGQAA